MIGVTGATGRLGQALMARFGDRAVPIGREMPNVGVTVLVHAAAPRAQHPANVSAFRRYNMQVREYVERWSPKVINIGSCWQMLEGECYYTAYSDLKREQSKIFAGATEIIPYWVYGPSKGFIHAVREAMQGHGTVTSAGWQLRDFVHVDDVAAHIDTAIDLPIGRYASCSLQPIEPIEVLRKAGICGRVVEPFPNAHLSYPLPVVGTTSMTVWRYLGL